MIDATLSHYHITAELGRGGMGIVYRATDTRLNREVAIKVLPSAALTSDDDRARFFREAQAAAQLTHAHIATVYEIDEAVPEDSSGAPVNASDGPHPFIAMEFIEGETLEAHIKKGPLKLKEAVRLASEVADALQAAHAKNIVHRDIKSANVMMTADGKAKVLDFGLAKTTHSTKLTRMGSTLGTVAFMSPEQARGEEVDRRTDLYSLGTMLYEMIAGRRPFAGEYEQAVVYGILNELPEPLTALRSGVPMNLEWIVNKCLAKSADDRYQTASELMVDLRNLDLGSSGVSRVSTLSSAPLSAIGTAATPAPVQPVSKKPIAPITAVATVAIVLGLLGGFFAFHTTPPAQPLTRVSIDLPGIRSPSFAVLSPTREFLAFAGVDLQNRSGLFLRDMASGTIRMIEGAGGATGGGSREIAFSPDGGRLAYTSGGNGGVFTVVVPAGLPERQTTKGRFSFWEDDNTFIFVDDQPGGKTFRKAIGTSEPVVVDIDHGPLPEGYVTNWKTRIPGSGIAFGHQLARTSNLQNENSFLVRAHLRDGVAVERVESPIMNPEYVRGGFLVYQQRNDTGTLVVRPVDPETGAFLGPPREALDGERTQWGQFSVTPDGDLLYRPVAEGAANASRSLFLVDLENSQATRVPLVVPDGSDLRDVAFSPDGSRLAFTVGATNGIDLVVYNFQDKILTQISFGLNVIRPSWSRDGEWLYYSAWTDSTAQIFRQHPDATATPEMLLSDAFMGDTSPDGQYLVFSRPDSGNATNDSNLKLLDLETYEVRTLDAGPGSNRKAQFSPDGKYIVYQHFLSGARLRVVSMDGFRVSEIPDVIGRNPRWSATGDRIYFSGNQTYQIPVRTSPSFNLLAGPELLFNSADGQGFDIAPDGKSAAVMAASITFDSVRDIESGSQIIWLQNWSAYLKRAFAK